MQTVTYHHELVPKNTGESDPGHAGCVLRQAFSGQARLLASRAERDLPLDVRSIKNLLRLYRRLALEELA